MGLGVSVFTLTLGLILKFAIQADAMRHPVDIHIVGVILIIVGGVTFALQLLMTAGAQSRRGDPSDRDRLYKNDRPPPP
ncbi:hypothetical protein DZF91_00980 [Actinomadura logoneensis]|uniref:DUF6458 domain-containing protein n=1 Tax=Actinomadura logoneensis TaxID=2293572 RepID=A0A372JTX1_9ACTN|nr:DUF6458 family protein [Actinomadura logoneensis]RFU43475.1 hypothetical protein DZF91_00980 [Actinomadura logoneensis]